MPSGRKRWPTLIPPCGRRPRSRSEGEKNQAGFLKGSNDKEDAQHRKGSKTEIKNKAKKEATRGTVLLQLKSEARAKLGTDGAVGKKHA